MLWGAIRIPGNSYVLLNLIGELKDGHANVYTASAVKFRPYTPPRFLRDADAFDLEIVCAYFSNPLLTTGNGTIHYEIASDSIGYVYFSTFGGELRDNADEIDDVVSLNNPISPKKAFHSFSNP